MRILRIFLKSLLILWAVSGPCYGVNIDGKEIGRLSVGVVLPLSGPQAVYGEEALSGIRLALEDFHEFWPKLGTLISLLVEDDRSTSEGARQAAERLIERKASLLIGSLAPFSSSALEQVSAHAGIPLIIPADRMLPEKTPSSHIVRSCSLLRWQGAQLSDFALKGIGKKSAGVLYDAVDSLQHDIVERFKVRFLDGGGRIIATETYRRELPAFEEKLSRIAEAKPEFILFPVGNQEDVLKVMKVLRKLQQGLPLLGPASWGRNSLAAQAGAAWPGHFYVSPFSDKVDTPKVRSFVRRFREKHQRAPGVLAAMAYDAMILAADSFRRSLTNLPAGLRRELKKTSGASGLLGRVTVGPDQSARNSGVIFQTTGAGASEIVMITDET